MKTSFFAFTMALLLARLAVAADAPASAPSAPSAKPAKPAAQQRAAIKAVKSFDLDRSHTIDENELAELNRAYSEAPKGPLAPLDRNEDQKIDADEAAIVNLGTPRLPGLKALDADHDGQIEGDEAAALRAQFEKVTKGPLRSLDVNHDGQLDDAEVAALNERLAKPPVQARKKAGTAAASSAATDGEKRAEGHRHRRSAPAAAGSTAAPVIPPEDIGTGTAQLNWQPPTQNADGTPLRNLSGYVIRYGRNADALNRRVVVDDPHATEYVVDKLGQGKWYFSVSALAKDGAESAAGKVVSKTIGPD